MVMKEKINAKSQQVKLVNETLTNAYKHNKYAVSSQTLKQHIISKVPTWLKSNVIANATLFILGSVMWIHGTHTRSFDPDYDKPGQVKTGPYLEQRTYQQALKDAYWPFVNGKFAPDLDWQLTLGLIITFATFSLAGMVMSAKKSHKKDLDTARTQVDIMLEIEKQAQEHNLDATTAKKIVNVAPKIIKNMSADSRVYFDIILDGKISVQDEGFIAIASAIMAGHLKTHPEDMELVMSTFDKNSIPDKLMAMYNKQQQEKR